MMNGAYRTEPKNPVPWYYKNVNKFCSDCNKPRNNVSAIE